MLIYNISRIQKGIQIFFFYAKRRKDYQPILELLQIFEMKYLFATSGWSTIFCYEYVP